MAHGVRERVCRHSKIQAARALTSRSLAKAFQFTALADPPLGLSARFQPAVGEAMVCWRSFGSAIPRRPQDSKRPMACGHYLTYLPGPLSMFQKHLNAIGNVAEHPFGDRARHLVSRSYRCSGLCFIMDCRLQAHSIATNYATSHTRLVSSVIGVFLDCDVSSSWPCERLFQ